jgi:hypothetical protein
MMKDNTDITYENLPLRSYSNPFIQDYVPPVEALAPQGDHSMSGILCALGPITFLQRLLVQKMLPISWLIWRTV